MCRLEIGLPTGIDFMHYNFVDFDPDTSIAKAELLNLPPGLRDQVVQHSCENLLQGEKAVEEAFTTSNDLKVPGTDAKEKGSMGVSGSKSTKSKGFVMHKTDSSSNPVSKGRMTNSGGA